MDKGILRLTYEQLDLVRGLVESWKPGPDADPHPLFIGEIGVWNGVMLLDTKSHQAFGRVMRGKSKGPRVFYPELPLRPALWLLPDGRAPGETRHTPLGKNYPW